MVITIDTREKEHAIQKIITHFEKVNQPYVLQKLSVGDYAVCDDEGNILNSLTVDRKQTLGELTTNLFTNDKRRFYDEIIRARKNKIKMVILCEHSNQIKTIKDVAKYHNPHSKVSGRELMEALYTIHISYGVEILFCDKAHTGQKIIELLK